MSLIDAVREDIAHNLARAADCYEEVIQAGDASIEAYLNLAVLYWQCTDYAFNVHYRLTFDLIDHSAKRYPELLQEAERRFPHESEIKFWILYCAYITAGGPDFVEECEALVTTGSKSLVPYFYIYDAHQGDKYEAEAKLLLEECLKSATVKNKYIVSVTESKLNTSRRLKSRTKP